MYEKKQVKLNTTYSRTIFSCLFWEISQTKWEISQKRRQHRHHAALVALVVVDSPHSIAMSPGKKKKKHDGPCDVRHRIVVFSAGSSPLKSTSTAARHVNRSVSSSVLSSVTHSSSSTPAPEIFEIFESDEETPRVNDSAFSLDPRRVLSAHSRGSGLHNKELEQVVMTSAIAHRLKKNASAGDSCFSVEELLGWMEDLVTNRLAICAVPPVKPHVHYVRWQLHASPPAAARPARQRRSDSVRVWMQQRLVPFFNGDGWCGRRWR